MYVYLIHFSRPYHHARHYIGFTSDYKVRFALHKQGKAARLTQVVVDSGIKLRLVRVWIGGRTFERRLKNRKNAKLLCPICNPAMQQYKVDNRRKAI